MGLENKKLEEKISREELNLAINDALLRKKTSPQKIEGLYIEYLNNYEKNPKRDEESFKKIKNKYRNYLKNE